MPSKFRVSGRIHTRAFLVLCILADLFVLSHAAQATEPRPGTPDNSTATTKMPVVGCPLAPGKMKLIEDEIRQSLKIRGMEPAFERFAQYAAAVLDRSAGRSRSELAGNCRLSWFDGLLRKPLDAPAAAERFSRELHTEVVMAERGWLDRLLVMAAEKLDLKLAERVEKPMPQSPEEAVELVKHAVEAAHAAHRTAVAPLSPAELKLLDGRLYTVLTGEVRFGHTLVSRQTARQMLDLLELKMDRAAMVEAAQALSPLADREFLERLAQLHEGEERITVEGATGDILRRVETAAGAIIIGGRGRNTYHLDQMGDVCAVIDLGGDDEYLEGVVSLRRPVLVLIDLGGDDTYIATQPGAQGGSILGVSMLLNLAGNNTYRARDVAQGSTLGGVGILVDYAGNDVYTGIRRVQGQAIAGLGFLVDRAGNDRYHAAMWAQGFGGPLGFGLLDDLDGDDHYYAGGLYLDTYPETPGYEGWAQGVGAGLRAVANGGVGVILDGGGDDVYEFDYFGHGGGYWLGVGIARDFAGNDQRLGATRVAFDGKPRSQRRYQRFGNGFACHYALGFLFDDEGDDVYGGDIMSTGFGWDLGVGVLADFAGNDRYEATGQHAQGSGAQASVGILFDHEGDDVYLGRGQGYASPSISYHPMPRCGGNFGFVIDYGGDDQYGSGARNNAYTVRGSQGGFVIDRPKKGELEGTKETHPVQPQPADH